MNNPKEKTETHGKEGFTSPKGSIGNISRFPIIEKEHEDLRFEEEDRFEERMEQYFDESNQNE